MTLSSFAKTTPSASVKLFSSLSCWSVSMACWPAHRSMSGLSCLRQWPKLFVNSICRLPTAPCKTIRIVMSFLHIFHCWLWAPQRDCTTYFVTRDQLDIHDSDGAYNTDSTLKRLKCFKGELSNIYRRFHLAAHSSSSFRFPNRQNSIPLYYETPQSHFPPRCLDLIKSALLTIFSQTVKVFHFFLCSDGLPKGNENS